MMLFVPVCFKAEGTVQMLVDYEINCFPHHSGFAADQRKELFAKRLAFPIQRLPWESIPGNYPTNRLLLPLH